MLLAAMIARALVDIKPALDIAMKTDTVGRLLGRQLEEETQETHQKLEESTANDGPEGGWKEAAPLQIEHDTCWDASDLADLPAKLQEGRGNQESPLRLASWQLRLASWQSDRDIRLFVWI